jgi:serine phosphatase RsbU (regulator of sigma subunit)/PAS domain-containing protein
VSAGERRAVIYGLIVAGGFVAIDIALSNSRISGAYALGAIVAGVLGGFRASVIVSAAAIALAIASPIWNDDFGSEGYFALLFVAACGSLLALGAGRLRDQVVDQLDRQGLLTAAADLPVPSESLEQTVARVTTMLVPRFAGYAAVEAEVAGERVPLGSRGTEPIDGGETVAIPLRARGRTIGRLSISGGRRGADDPEFLRVFAGRVALALDNAGLSQELVTVEQQLQAILENLGEAVTVQDRKGRLVFANPAAAGLLDAGSVDELLSTPPAEIVERFTTVNEDGGPIDVTKLPGRIVLEGGEAEPLVVRATSRKTGEERWRMTKSTAVRGPGGDVILAVNVIEDITESKRAELAQRLLADASAVLASSLDYTSTLQQVAELAVPRLADWCAVSMPNGDLLEQVAIAHGDPKLREVAQEYARRWPARLTDPSGNVEVLRSGQPLLIPEVTEEMWEQAPIEPEQREVARRLGASSVLAVPMGTPELVVGVLALVNGEGSRRFDAADLELALELGRRAATAVENARLHTQLEQVATTLQRTLLPPDIPEVPGWNISSLYLPAGGEAEVGGDFYDVFPTAAGWMAVMGDVVGRGPAAASLTAMGRYTLRTAGSLVGTPTMGLARLNDNLRERGEMALCTAAVLQLRDNDGAASLVCAGHPLPYLVRGGEAHAVGRTGPLLGAFEHGHWLAANLEIEPGDVLVLYTDGVLDARGPDSRFGEERLEAALSGVTSAEDAVERIRAALFEFAGAEQDDDIAVLALQKL